MGNDYASMLISVLLELKITIMTKNSCCDDLNSLVSKQYPEYCNWNRAVNICGSILNK